MNVLNEQKRVGNAVKREEVITLMSACVRVCVFIGNVHSHTQANAHQLWLISVCLPVFLSFILFYSKFICIVVSRLRPLSLPLLVCIGIDVV